MLYSEHDKERKQAVGSRCGMEIWDKKMTNEQIERMKREDPEFRRYLELNPQDPAGNYFVHGWDDPNYEPGAWIWALHS